MDNPATVYSSARTNIYYPVRCFDCVLIVLNNNKSVSKLSELNESVDQSSVISLMQSNGGLIQHVQHARQSRADLGGQANSLSFATGERARCTLQGKIVEAHRHKKIKPCSNLPQHLCCNFLVAFSKFQLCKEIDTVA